MNSVHTVSPADMSAIGHGQPEVSAHEAHLKYNIKIYNNEHILLI